MKASTLPPGLRTWFIIHFAADMLFGIPLLFFPEVLLPLLGWGALDPISTRVVGAALMGIGIESLLARDASTEVYRAMLNLKVIWSGSALLGIGLGMLNGGPAAGWLFFGVFLVFFGVWVYYRRQLK